MGVPRSSHTKHRFDPTLEKLHSLQVTWSIISATLQYFREPRFQMPDINKKSSKQQQQQQQKHRGDIDSLAMAKLNMRGFLENILCTSAFHHAHSRSHRA
ncbi:uncharacterized protein UV8b_01286 [Ustilaginoidea virens]|uniref:Uncharacterized protein n=1 Tax=Ustilaginoidea virens TaxID=1159556 RepID=A0A8E5HKC2_USTVR|nr:uncharacterized protein UV8b_01286 [Ustilaginoidea virens]QUC17045.1 hypothetical protein UV8b_01286 [Ustilaginoidea virens]